MSARAAAVLVAGLAVAWPAASTRAGADPADFSQAGSLSADLDAIFAAPALERAIMAVRVESLRDGRLVYARQNGIHVVPASNMKIVTLAVAAERLGWGYQYETRLEADGVLAGGRLTGDLIVVGSGDPTITAPDGTGSSVFDRWADDLWNAGVRRVDGRLIGDDTAFDDEGLGAGWAWDYLGSGYATPTGALLYNENVAVLRAEPGRALDAPVAVTVTPPGHGMTIVNNLRTGAPDSRARLDLFRLPGTTRLTLEGSLPAGGRAMVQTAAVDNPTRFFVDALRFALAARGIVVRDGAWDIDDLPARPDPRPGTASGTSAPGTRRVIARRVSAPLSSVGAAFLKASQNLYGETILKTIGRTPERPGTAEGGRLVVRAVLADWRIPADAVVMYDGSGLSRYNYVTADAIVAILRRVWDDERLRGPFLAALPVGGADGTLSTRMKDAALLGRVQAKTGTIANVRALSGFLEAASGERFVFSMIANHFTAPSAEIDAVAERALARIARHEN